MTGRVESDLPKDPADYKRAQPGLGLWSLMALCLLCVLAGAGLTTLLPRLLPEGPRPAGPRVTPVPAAQPSLPSARVESSDAAEIRRLNARIAALESEGARTSEAAASALAAAALVEATQSSRPFVAELGQLRAVAPELPELVDLARVAAEGAPSRAALADSFPGYAAKAASAARRPGPNARLGDRLAYGLSRIVSVRQVNVTEGSSPDAILARAERALAEGNVADALKALDELPPAALESVAPWRASAQRRAEIDRHASRLRARAVRDLQAAGLAPVASPARAA